MAILAFVLIFMPFNKASANEVFVPVHGYYNDGYYYNANQSPYQPPIYTPPPAPAPTPIVYSNSVNPNAENSATVPKTAKVKTASAVKTVASSASTKNSNTYSGLAANAFYGISGFLPSGLIQWIMFAILILLLVILTRIIFNTKENYHATPLKHE